MKALADIGAGPQALVESGQAEARSDRIVGFWFYLMSDAVIFALLFATYAVMADRTADGPTGRDFIDLSRAFAETMLLLASSFIFGLASIAAQSGKRDHVVLWLAFTFGLGAAFLAMELNDFAGMVAVGAGPDRSGFLSAFFTLVGTHGLHVTAGLVWIAVMAAQIMAKGLAPPVMSRVERLGLFWHFLDIVWIGIFTFVYLAGVI